MESYCSKTDGEDQLEYDCPLTIEFSFEEISTLTYELNANIAYDRNIEGEQVNKYYPLSSINEKRSAIGFISHELEGIVQVMDDENFFNERDSSNPAKLGSKVYVKYSVKESSVIDGVLEFERAEINLTKQRSVSIKPIKTERAKDNVLYLTF